MISRQEFVRTGVIFFFFALTSFFYGDNPFSIGQWTAPAWGSAIYHGVLSFIILVTALLSLSCWIGAFCPEAVNRQLPFFQRNKWIVLTYIVLFATAYLLNYSISLMNSLVHSATNECLFLFIYGSGLIGMVAIVVFGFSEWQSRRIVQGTNTGRVSLWKIIGGVLLTHELWLQLIVSTVIGLVSFLCIQAIGSIGVLLFMEGAVTAQVISCAAAVLGIIVGLISTSLFAQRTGVTRELSLITTGLRSTLFRLSTAFSAATAVPPLNAEQNALDHIELEESLFGPLGSAQIDRLRADWQLLRDRVLRWKNFVIHESGLALDGDMDQRAYIKEKRRVDLATTEVALAMDALDRSRKAIEACAGTLDVLEALNNKAKWIAGMLFILPILLGIILISATESNISCLSKLNLPVVIGSFYLVCINIYHCASDFSYPWGRGRA
jgi:hypothetical protein